jgi:hypothetical protein
LRRVGALGEWNGQQKKKQKKKKKKKLLKGEEAEAVVRCGAMGRLPARNATAVT